MHSVILRLSLSLSVSLFMCALQNFILYGLVSSVLTKPYKMNVSSKVSSVTKPFKMKVCKAHVKVHEVFFFLKFCKAHMQNCIDTFIFYGLASTELTFEESSDSPSAIIIWKVEILRNQQTTKSAVTNHCRADFCERRAR